MTEQPIENKWEYFSDIRIKISECLLGEEKYLYKLIYDALKKLTGMEAVIIFSEAITYKNHIAITNDGIDEEPWHQWFDEFAGKKEENTPNLRNLIWENKNSTELNTEKEVADTFLYQDSKIKIIPIKSWFSTPIIWGENENAKIVGSIIIYSKDKENNDKSLYDVNFIEKFSKHLSILFKNKRIFDRDRALDATARKFDLCTKNTSTFDEVVNNILAVSYEDAEKLMNVNDFLAFVVPEKHLSTSSKPELYLSYKKGEKTENEGHSIFTELACYIIKNPKEKILWKNKAEIEEKLSAISLNFQSDKLPETLIVVPMSLGTDEARGAFILYHMGHESAYDEDDRKVIDRLSDQAALAIDTAHSQQLKDRTHRERHKALFDMNSVLFKFDSSNLKKDEAIQEVLKVAIKHIDKVGINIKNVSMFTKYFQNRADLEDETKKPDLQLVHHKKEFIFNYSENNIQPYIEAAALHVINNPENPLLFKNKNNFKESGLNISNDEKIPLSFLAVPMRLEESLASGAFVFCGDSENLYDEDDLQFIDDITDSVALIIKNILMRIEKEKILFDMSRTLLGFVQLVGEKSNEEIIEKILTTSCEHTQRLAKADNMMIYMSHSDNEASNKKTSLQLRKSFENGKEVAVNKAKKLMPFELIEYVITNPKTPIIWGSIEDALEIIKRLNLTIKLSDIPKSLLIVPMSLEINNPAKGAFILYDFDFEHRYENEDKDFVDELSDQVAIIIQNLLLNHTKQELEARNKELIKQLEISSKLGLSNKKLSKTFLAVSNDLMSHIGSSEYLEKDIHKIHDFTAEIMDVDNMYIALCDDKKKKITFPSFYINGKKIYIEERDFSKGRTEWIINEQKHILIDTRENSIKWYKDNNFESVGDPLASWLGVPISIGNKQLGVIATFHPEKDNVYDESDLKILQSLANQIAIAIDKSRQYKEIKEAYTRLAEVNIRLAEANKTIAQTQDTLTKSLIANDLVHRLNNLASPIPMWIKLCNDELKNKNILNDKLEIYFQEIVENATNILNEAKEINRTETKRNISIKNMLKALIRQTSIQYRNEIQEKRLIIQHDIAEKIYPISFIPSTINHAIFCIISNGIESILEKGTGFLTIRSRNIVIEDSDWVNITIEDTGTGINKEMQNKIFEPYMSLKAGLGRGYGLWRTKTVIEEAGGKIIFTSPLENSSSGAIFSVFLPKSIKG